MNSKLIFDIGFHKGEDSKHYLDLGYKVIAVEANPLLVDFGKRKFANHIKSGQLVLLNKGIANKNETLTFWINDKCSEWSSFDKNIGCRDNTPCHSVAIDCIKTADLINEYGIPFYMKIDIEGYDIYCIESLHPNQIPKYISCEAQQIEWLDTIYDKGYRKFKIINQADRFNELIIQREKSSMHHYKRYLINGIMHRTSEFISWKFPIKSSGPFGENTKGSWKTIDEVKKLYSEYFQFEKKEPLSTISWFDFHATT